MSRKLFFFHTSSTKGGADGTGVDVLGVGGVGGGGGVASPPPPSPPRSSISTSSVTTSSSSLLLLLPQTAPNLLVRGFRASSPPKQAPQALMTVMTQTVNASQKVGLRDVPSASPFCTSSTVGRAVVVVDVDVVEGVVVVVVGVVVVVVVVVVVER